MTIKSWLEKFWRGMSKNKYNVSGHGTLKLQLYVRIRGKEMLVFRKNLPMH